MMPYSQANSLVESSVENCANKDVLGYSNGRLDAKLLGFCYSKCAMSQNGTFFFLRKGSEGYAYICDILSNRCRIDFKETLMLKTSTTLNKGDRGQQNLSYVAISFETTSSLGIDQLDLYSAETCVQINKVSGVTKKAGASAEVRHEQYPKMLELDHFLEIYPLSDRIRFVQGLCLGDMLTEEERTKLLRASSGRDFSPGKHDWPKDKDSFIGKICRFFDNQTLLGPDPTNVASLKTDKKKKKKLNVICFRQESLFYKVGQLLSTIAVLGESFPGDADDETSRYRPEVTGVYVSETGQDKRIRTFEHGCSEYNNHVQVQNGKIFMFVIEWS